MRRARGGPLDFVGGMARGESASVAKVLIQNKSGYRAIGSREACGLERRLRIDL
jgi:hypothetical protein